MKFRELFEIAEKNGWMDKEIAVQYRDGGGDYCGTDDYIYFCEDDETGKIVL